MKPGTLIRSRKPFTVYNTRYDLEIGSGNPYAFSSWKEDGNTAVAIKPRDELGIVVECHDWCLKVVYFAGTLVGWSNANWFEVVQEPDENGSHR